MIENKLDSSIGKIFGKLLVVGITKKPNKTIR